MSKKELIENLLTQEAEARGWFVLDAKVLPAKGAVQLRLVVDSEAGIGIEDCAKLSRELYPLIENTRLYEDFELMVSSPGVGEPLKFPFQIQKNVGRTVKITRKDKSTLEGKLIAFSEDQILTVEYKKNKKSSTEPVQIAWSDIEKIIVLVTFN